MPTSESQKPDFSGEWLLDVGRPTGRPCQSSLGLSNTTACPRIRMETSDSGSRMLAAVPQFTVPDLPATVRYYHEVLGFQVAGYWGGEGVTPTSDPSSVFAIVFRDDVQLFFSRADQAGASGMRTGRADGAYDVYLRVTGIDELAKELRRRGANIVDGPEDRVYGQRELVVVDCNDLVLAFGEYTNEAVT
jgi:catechol 2,3-dioxygenase-like lactoylglutathione lyase family enzyme